MDDNNIIPVDADSLAQGWVFSVDKPEGWTSFDVVAKLRNTIKGRYGVKVKIGHAGTLDPLATGVLVICVGKATKMINQWVDAHKEYRAVFNLGSTTKTYDLESEISPTGKDVPIFSEKIKTDIESKFVGLISQTPPAFSAIRVNGERAYKQARKGIHIDMPERKITVYSLDWLNTNGKSWEVNISCSKGTYIRSLANDIGQFLGCGAYLGSLVRTAVGDHIISDSRPLAEWITLLGQD
jgi:tRNA pseudouridine55 synthase